MDRRSDRCLRELGFTPQQRQQLQVSLSQISYADEARWRAQLQRLADRLRRSPAAVSAEQGAAFRQLLDDALLQARRAQEQRLKAQLQLSYPAQLPVSAQRAAIIKALTERQVVIIAGDTGSGKTTQLPKMCLEAGLGVRGLIGHTQPRRIAARTVAARLAAELGQELGHSVGYKVRFSDRTSAQCRIKLMTDGMLLSEIAADRQLLNYECLIIDEAHERSLNIDFLLGYLTTLLRRRPELRLVITSATLDLQRLSGHFAGAEVITVAGRTFPIDVAYMPLVAERDAEGGTQVTEMTLNEGIAAAVQLLQDTERGDVLVFLPGEREITQALAWLKRQELRDTEILPLYARLAFAEQERVFREHRGVRIVLATNVAETSITVPGIKYVIDTGLARISRYSARTKIQHLQIEPISRSAADQRKGRCGRLSPGICVRLYSEEDYLSRPQYTDPEIKRSNLAAVILQMLYLHLGDISSFPFIDPPQPRQIRDGLRLLHEIGAIGEYKNLPPRSIKLTATGREIARLPIDPRLGRMIAAAARQGSLSEVLILCAALAVSDPREFPLERREAALQAHARFRDDKSDFQAILKLYAYLQTAQHTHSRRQFAAFLQENFISYLRTKEWFDLHLQLRLMCRSLGYTFNELPADYQALHSSLIPGLLSNLGAQTADPGEYLGANGLKFSIAPGSYLFRRRPKFIIAAEIVQTSKTFARHVAAIEPHWVYPYAQHLLRRTYSDVHFAPKRGAAMAYMTASLYALPIITRQPCMYNQIDPQLSRELLIREGLLGGTLRCRLPFYVANLRLLEQVHALEDKLRSRNLLADDNILYDFYDARLPPGITCLADLDVWYGAAVRADPQLLCLDWETVTSERVRSIEGERYPDELQFGQLTFRLSYTFDPQDARDGVSVHIPLALLNQLDPDPFNYLIPSLREALYEALIRSLPKRLRRNLIPAPEYARALQERMAGMQGSFLSNAAQSLSRIGGALIESTDFDLSQIDPCLLPTFVIEDRKGQELAAGKDLAALIAQLQPQLQQTLDRAGSRRRGRSRTTWDFGDLHPRQAARHGAQQVVMYPAVADLGDAVCIEYCHSPHQQQHTMRRGECRLLLLSVGTPVAYLQQHLPNRAKLALYYQGLGSIASLIDELCLACIDSLVMANGGYVYHQADFARLAAVVKEQFPARILRTAAAIEQILLRAHDLRRQLAGRIEPGEVPAYRDTQGNLQALIYPGFIMGTPQAYLGELGRYLEAMQERLRRVRLDISRDQAYQRRLDNVDQAYQQAHASYRGQEPDGLQDVWWSIQELRVSYFAQKLGVRQSVSDKRILEQLQRLLTQQPPVSAMSAASAGS